MSEQKTATGLDVLGLGRRVVRQERDALDQVLELLDDAFVRAADAVLNCTGRVAVSGVGKAGLIGAKIAATLSSTGTPAYVLHPVEAIHGDLGMVGADDVVLALSNSGESAELVGLIPQLKKFGCVVIMITGRPQSRGAQLSNIVLNCGRVEEACPLGMAPSSSTTAMLALGDALALAVSEVKGFDKEQYAAVHPGGALGRSLMRIEEIMRTAADCPTIQVQGTVQDYLEQVMAAPSRAGAAVIVDGEQRLQGFFTNGDLCRLASQTENPRNAKLRDVMTHNPKAVQVGERVVRALELMQKHGIDEIPVVDEQRRVVGMVDIQDLLAAGFSLFDSR